MSWKLTKEYLKKIECVVCNSPKSCFKESFEIQLLTEEEVEVETMETLRITGERNFTTHTYHEEIADEIHHNIKEYCKLMSAVHQMIVEQ